MACKRVREKRKGNAPFSAKNECHTGDIANIRVYAEGLYLLILKTLKPALGAGFAPYPTKGEGGYNLYLNRFSRPVNYTRRSRWQGLTYTLTVLIFTMGP